jgi:hypothetical protein
VYCDDEHMFLGLQIELQHVLVITKRTHSM